MSVMRSAYAHNKKRHLLFFTIKPITTTVFKSGRIHSGRVDTAYCRFECVKSLFERSHVGAKNRIVFSGKGVTETVL